MKNLYIIYCLIKANKFKDFKDLVEIFIEHTCMIIEDIKEIKVSEKEIKKIFFEDLDKYDIKEIFDLDNLEK